MTTLPLSILYSIIKKITDDHFLANLASGFYTITPQPVLKNVWFLDTSHPALKNIWFLDKQTLVNTEEHLVLGHIPASTKESLQADFTIGKKYGKRLGFSLKS